ncbi:MAG: BPTI/Kunitz domain-containing protein [Bacteroidota bacterium]
MRGIQSILWTFVAGLCLMLVVWTGCKGSKTTQQPLDSRCMLKPDPGPCRAAIPRFYYDAESGTCKEFTYGGCQGTVPFETLEACEICLRN